VRAAAWLLTFALGASFGWYARDWEQRSALRRPGPALGQQAAPGELSTGALPPVEAGAPAPEPPPEPAGHSARTPAPTESAEPLRAATSDTPARAPDLDEPVAGATLQERLATLSRLAPGVNSIWFHDLRTGDSVSIRGERRYTAASTIKVPIAMYLYHLAANNRLNLDRKVAVQREDWAAGTGVLQAVAPGSLYTYRELARLSIVQSDNIAANVLMRTLGQEQLVSYLKEIGVRHDREQNQISPRDLGLAIRHLWRMALRYPKPWAQLLEYLQETAHNDRLPAGVPEGVPVAHKIGSVDLSFHDAGIVYHPQRPYILVVMTDTMGERAAARFISRVSREVWRWQDGAP
jgi:beta-lactamase class A